jgi:hypothetical protein
VFSFFFYRSGVSLPLSAIIGNYFAPGLGSGFTSRPERFTTVMFARHRHIRLAASLPNDAGELDPLFSRATGCSAETISTFVASTPALQGVHLVELNEPKTSCLTPGDKALAGRSNHGPGVKTKGSVSRLTIVRIFRIADLVPGCGNRVGSVWADKDSPGVVVV